MTVPRIVVVGAGFAGHTAARGLLHRLGDAAEIVVIDAKDHFLYLPLLPEVTTGVVEPRHVAVSLARSLPGARLVLGAVDRIDVDARSIVWTDPDGHRGEITYDRLVLTVGSVNRLLPIPGVADNAHGYRSIAEALYLRDHLVRQVELAAAASDPAERAARCTFVVVGAGYTGTEVAAQGARFTAQLAKAHPRLRDQRMRWMLLDTAPRVLPELHLRLSRTADRVLRERGVEVRTGESVAEARAHGVRLTGGEDVPMRTLVWCVGVRPDPLVDDVGLKTERGRLCVDPYLEVPGHPEIVAAGDAAAVPDLTRPGNVTAMTAQHATRQGALAARNVAAALGRGKRRRYRHHDLGFVVELGGLDAAANPLNVPLSGLPATAVTKGYHLLAMPGNRLRVVTDWLLDILLPTQAVQLGLVRGGQVPLGPKPELAVVAGPSDQHGEHAAVDAAVAGHDAGDGR
jgi:NADH:ubiquinone reductase (H+-translocating)